MTKAKTPIATQYLFPTLMKLPKVVVFGGHGFLGSQIVKQFPKDKYQLISLSRSLPSSKIPHVQYLPNIDVLKPETYDHIIKDADHVVHSIGVIFPNEAYKKIINSKSICDTFTGVCNYLTSNSSATSAKNKEMYDRINYQSVRKLSETFVSHLRKRAPAANTVKPSFTYISAEETPMLKTFISPEYISSKRKSELQILQYENDLRPIIVRPGLLYDEHAKELTPRSSFAFLMKNVNPFANQFMCSTQSVAKAIVNKVSSPDYKGGITTLKEL